ncbi:hypothetical protein AKJ61_04105 [candidate division MSBL1 archaeon SCGC-AAA259B11]|uniref:Glutamyl-tRNA reductase n=1 Tax=candidate division MSBL1 archaeon SCGC-AAA259B11 TaxID=1698260 RepID=A0A133U3Q8_9EURY|nr:hypothetical protein AKJ61_04105 [candidate division MSBL1 archaeon SCGC-AAA259B11]
MGLQITYEWAEVEELEAARLGKSCKACCQIADLKGIEECVVLQTCNRVEIYTVVSELQRDKGRLRKYAQTSMDLAVGDYIKFLSGVELLEHLLRLACGLESMVFGEDQILGQIEEEYETAQKEGTIGKVLNKAFEKSIMVGKKVRTETDINRGPTSVGSAAVGLAEELFGTLEDKNILIIGAGETARLVGKSLKERNPGSVTVANRTYERGLKLARKLDGEVVEFSDFTKLLPDTDVIISATGAPHFILEKRDMKGLISPGENLLIIDVANPRDVSEEVSEIENIELCDLDNLQQVRDRNLEKRNEEADKAESIIEKELDSLLKEYEGMEGDKMASEIHRKAEEIREREMSRAVRRLKKCTDSVNGVEVEVLEDLTRGLVRKTLHDPMSQIREASREGDKELLEAAEKLFDLSETRKDS